MPPRFRSASAGGLLRLGHGCLPGACGTRRALAGSDPCGLRLPAGAPGLLRQLPGGLLPPATADDSLSPAGELVVAVAGLTEFDAGEGLSPFRQCHHLAG